MFWMSAVLGYFQLINLLLMIVLCSGYRETVEKCLAEHRTHKELRNLKREIRQNLPSVRKRILYRFTKGALWAERAYLPPELLPPILPFIRNVFPCLGCLSLISMILGFGHQENKIFPAVGWSASVLMWILFAVYQISDRISIAKRLPKAFQIQKKLRKQNAFFRNPKHDRNYTPREWKIILQAYLLRYSPLSIALIPVCIRTDSVLLMGIIELITAVISEYHRRNMTEIFLCSYQDFSHRRMTPFEHTEAFAQHAQREMKLVSILDFVFAGMLLLTACILHFFS